MTVQRIGQVIKLKPDSYEEYKRLHAAVWPEVLETINKANIRNYSIFYWDGFLFSYMEYAGRDFDADMASIADDPKTREWWTLTDPLQQPVQGTSSGSVEGNWWTQMEMLFHTG
jgi:L-rhamnose mutarotase